MAYTPTLSQPAPARLVKLKAYPHAKDWREAFRFGYVIGRPAPYSPPHEAYGETHCRWVEDVDRAGLRLVGYVNESRHCLGGYFNNTPTFGWYSDNWHDETFYPVVYRLPARKGAARFVYGYADPCNKGAAYLSFDRCDNENDAQRWACHLTKTAAEESREFHAKGQAEQQIGDIGDQLDTIRRDVLALCLERKKVCASLTNAPTIRATVEGAIRAALRERETLRKRRKELSENPWAAVADY